MLNVRRYRYFYHATHIMQDKNHAKSTFQDRLKEVVDELGYSRADIASALDIAWSSVERWFGGSIPRRGTLDDLSAFLGVSSRWLKTGEGPREPELSPEARAALARGQRGLVSLISESPEELLATIQDSLAKIMATSDEDHRRSQAKILLTAAELLHKAATTSNP